MLLRDSPIRWNKYQNKKKFSFGETQINETSEYENSKKLKQPLNDFFLKMCFNAITGEERLLQKL